VQKCVKRKDKEMS